MVDRFGDPLLSIQEAARHLQLPDRTLQRWLRHDNAAGAPLVHSVEPVKRGWPSLPFVAVVEAYVLRSLRGYLSMSRIRDATEAVRNTFDDEYGLATRRIATDGVDIFVEYADGDLARARDGQRPIREVITDYLHYISWEPGEQYPCRLRLRQYPDVAPVIIDPRFGWGTPVVAGPNIQIDAIVGMWKAGESLETVAAEYGLSRDQVEAVCQVATRDRAA
ncbi:DUF433 domain-containing protein [Streptomyces sp. NPDC057236]|jgi:uncharacterized protein (DUF433 family)|uniref:DUF433 domain-containing protein n=1 Tax=Streptomyces sp. NPDC057236 TaxID=3346059 RepID=UPI003637D808